MAWSSVKLPSSSKAHVRAFNLSERLFGWRNAASSKPSDQRERKEENHLLLLRCVSTDDHPHTYTVEAPSRINAARLANLTTRNYTLFPSLSDIWGQRTMIYGAANRASIQCARPTDRQTPSREREIHNSSHAVRIAIIPPVYALGDPQGEKIAPSPHFPEVEKSGKRRACFFLPLSKLRICHSSGIRILSLSLGEGKKGFSAVCLMLGPARGGIAGIPASASSLP